MRPAACAVCARAARGAEAGCGAAHRARARPAAVSGCARDCSATILLAVVDLHASSVNRDLRTPYPPCSTPPWYRLLQSPWQGRGGEQSPGRRGASRPAPRGHRPAPVIVGNLSARRRRGHCRRTGAQCVAACAAAGLHRVGDTGARCSRALVRNHSLERLDRWMDVGSPPRRALVVAGVQVNKVIEVRVARRRWWPRRRNTGSAVPLP